MQLSTIYHNFLSQFDETSHGRAVASVGVDDYGAPSVALVLSPLDAFTAMRALFCFVVTHPAHN